MIKHGYICQIPHSFWKLAKGIKSLPRTQTFLNKTEERISLEETEWNRERRVWGKSINGKKVFFLRVEVARNLAMLSLDLKEK